MTAEQAQQPKKSQTAFNLGSVAVLLAAIGGFLIFRWTNTGDASGAIGFVLVVVALALAGGAVVAKIKG